MHSSMRQGESIDFAEHKQYSPGDDIRHIDWRVFARSDRLTVKRFEAETNLKAMIIVDFSASMAYRSGAMSKADYAALLGATVANLLLRQQDQVGLVAGGERNATVVPPATGLEHLRNIVGVLERITCAGGTDLESMIARSIQYLGRRDMLVVVSDLFDDESDWLRALQIMAARGGQLLVLQVLDPDELEFPFEDPTLFESMETPDKLLVYPRQLRRLYLEQLERWLAEVRRRLAHPAARYRVVSTGEPPHVPLLSVLGKPSKRARAV
ncbi:MAG: DUF58 domain-containing protein [Deltaproteobacteria bacterium]|nr:MAG: DUF58 domain-containing protein [Deltaproteobacteria bacterium]